MKKVVDIALHKMPLSRRVYPDELRFSVTQIALGRKIGGMYLIAIAWIYVATLMALTEPSVVAGVLTFALYGLGPLALFLWIMGTRHRRRLRYRREMMQSQEASSAQPPAPSDPPPTA